MSLIFDALQRSERERSGGESATPSSVTDLLRCIEQHKSTSEIESSPRPESQKAASNVDRDDRVHLQTALSISTADSSLSECGPLPEGRRPELFDRFQSLPIAITARSQLVCVGERQSLVAEKFRFLGVRLRHLQRERALKKLLITSTIPREGKSTVAANLACMLARKKQQRTLLIEGDVRRPALSQLFGLQTTPGLCDWLQGNEEMLSNIYHLEDLDLWILPAGRTADNPLELLQSARLSALMIQVNSLFDWVIIDSPPVLPLADTSVWSRLADGILLVTRQGTTEKRQLQRGLEALDHEKLIGALLNCSHSPARNDHYYYYRPSSSLDADTALEK